MKRVSLDELMKLHSSFTYGQCYAYIMELLEALSQMSLIQRFPLRRELYDKILEQPQALERLEYFLRPLPS